MLTKKPTFKPIARLSSYAHCREEFPVSILEATGVSSPGKDFIRSLMASDPDNRLTSKQAIEHQWIKHLSELPMLPRAPVLIDSTILGDSPPTHPQETTGETAEKEDSSTARPRDKVSAQTPDYGKDESENQDHAANEAEAIYEEEETSGSQTSFPHEETALSIRSTNSKQDSSDGTSLSQITPSSEKYSEEWWNNHLKKAGLLGSSPKEKEMTNTSNAKKPVSSRSRAPSKPATGPEEHQITNAADSVSLYLDTKRDNSESFLRESFPGDLIDLAGRKDGDKTALHQSKDWETPSPPIYQENDIRSLASSFMLPLDLHEAQKSKLDDLAPSHAVRPSFGHSRSADDANIDFQSSSGNEDLHVSTIGLRMQSQKHVRSRTHSDVLETHTPQQETEEESRDPSRGIVALPLIKSDDEIHRRSLMGFRGTSTGANAVVGRIAAGLGFRGNPGLNEKKATPSSDGIRFQFSLHVGAKHRRQISYCPRNLRLVTASGEPNGVEVWNVSSRRRLFADNLFKSNSKIAISNTGNLFAATSGNHLTIWNSFDGTSTKIASTEDLKNPQFSHDSKLLAAMSKQKRLHIWRVRYTGRNSCLVKLEKHRTLSFEDHVVAFAFQIKRERIVIALNNAIKIKGVSDSQDDIDGTYHFDPSVMGKSLKPTRSNVDRGLVTAISANGRVAAQSEPDGIIGSILFIRDLTYRADSRSHKFLVSPVIQNMEFSYGGEILATSTKNRDVILWDAFGGKRLTRLENCHPSSITGIFLADKGDLLATCSSSEDIKFWGTDRSVECLVRKGDKGGDERERLLVDGQ